MFGVFILLFLLSLILLVVGLIKPGIIPKNKSRRKSSLIFGLATIVFFILIGITAPPSSPKTTESTTTPTPEPTATNRQTIKVVRVVDGDTIEIEGGQKVRYIGIDTPETVDPRKSVQCFGKEASDKNKELVEGKDVELEKDVSETDKYGRLLRYIWIGDLLVNEFLVQEGYAQSSSYPPDVKYQERFNEAEQKAREEEKGLWGEICATTPTPTKTITPKPTPTVSTSKTTTPKTPTPTPLPQVQTIQPVQPVSGSYVCNCSKTCPQMSSCAEAQYQLNVCGCQARDADKDGIACDADCQ
jgi:micrococcal nuclease